MHRRQFMGTCTTAALGVGAFSHKTFARTVALDTARTSSPFPFSVMLWTVDPQLPFADRIGKVAEAGYHAVELVGEYEDWSEEDFAHARTRFHSVDMVVDACSGIRTSLCDPSQRDTLLAEIQAKLPVLGELECSRLILLAGDKVPGLSHEQMHASCVEGLKRAADIAAARNIELLLENIDPEENPKYFLTSVAEGFEVIR